MSHVYGKKKYAPSCCLQKHYAPPHTEIVGRTVSPNRKGTLPQLLLRGDVLRSNCNV